VVALSLVIRAWREKSPSSNLIRLDPPIEITAVNMHAPTLANYDEFPLVDQMLNGLLTSANIRSSLFDREKPSCRLWPSVILLDLRSDPCRNLRRQGHHKLFVEHGSFLLSTRAIARDVEARAPPAHRTTSASDTLSVRRGSKGN
jgi:hypothetical protein